MTVSPSLEHRETCTTPAPAKNAFLQRHYHELNELKTNYPALKFSITNKEVGNRLSPP